MPGRIIDRIVLTALAASAAYLALLNTGAGIVPSALLTFALVCMFGEILRRVPTRRRFTAAQAETALASIAAMPDSEADAALRDLAAAHTPGARDCVCIVRHPSSRIGTDTVFGIWKAHRGADRVVIAATCIASDEASALARSLASPSILPLDGRTLSRTIRRTGLYVPPEAPRRALPHRLRGLAHAIMAHRAGPRALLYGLGLWGLYLVLGRPLYLFCAVAVLFHCGASWIRRAGA